MSAMRFAALVGYLPRRTAPSASRTFATEARQREASGTDADSITASWSLKLDFGDDAKDSKVSVTSVINELIREWLGPRKKKGRERFSWFVRTKSTGREVDADGFLFKPGALIFRSVLATDCLAVDVLSESCMALTCFV